MKTDSLHRTGRVVILFLILLLLAQGASAVNITLDPDGIMNVSGNRTYPVSLYYMCSQYFNTLYECSASLAINKNNFTYSMGDEIYGNADTQWPKYIPMFDTAGVGFVLRSQSLPVTNTSINASPQIWHTQISADGTYDSRGSDEPPYLNLTARASVYADANRSTLYYPTKLKYMNNFDQMINWLNSGYINIFGFDNYANKNAFLSYYSRVDIVYAHERWHMQSFDGYYWNNSIFKNRSVISVIMGISYDSSGWFKFTQPEVRAVTWDSIASGYHGISYYGWQPYMADPSPGLWENVTVAGWYRDLGTEIKSLNSILILPTTSLFWENDRNESYVNITPNPLKTVYVNWPQQKQFVYLLKQPNASVSYLIAVNKDQNSSGDVQIKIGGVSGTQNITFLGNATSGSGESTSNNASQTITATNGVFNDTFDGYAVHIYEISNATAEEESSNTWTISGSGGNATWSSFPQDNVTEDMGDYDIKIGIFADNFNDNNLNGWTTTGGTHTVSNGIYKQQTGLVEWMTARPTTFSYASPAVILAKANVTDNGTYLDKGLGWGSSTWNVSTNLFAGRRDEWNQWELRRNNVLDSNNIASRTLNVWSNLQLYKKSNSYNYSSSYNNVLMSTTNSPTNSQYPYLLGSSDLLQYWDDVRIVPLDSNNNIVTRGNLTTWHNWTDSNVTYQVTVNATTPANTNYSIYGGQNGTELQLIASEHQTGNQTISIGSEKFENYDVMIRLYGNETATPELMSITYYSQAPVTYAPNITSWSNTKTNNGTANLTVNASESVTFNSTANQTITTWNWYVNGSNQNNNYDNISLSYGSEGIRLVQVNATNSNGTSNTVSWNMTVVVPDTSTVWTTGIGGQFFQNKTIGSNRTCINQGDGSIQVGYLCDNFNDNNSVGWNTTGGTWTTTNGLLNITSTGYNRIFYNVSSYTNISIYAKFMTNNLSSYIDVSSIRGNRTRGGEYQFSVGGSPINRTYLFRYNESGWENINVTATQNRVINQWNYSILKMYGTALEGYLGSSYTNALLSIQTSGAHTQYQNGSAIGMGANPVGGSIVSLDEIRAVELDAQGNQYLQGNYSMNYTVPVNQYAKNITINGTYPAGTNYSLKYRQNATGNYISVGGVKTADSITELPTPYFQNIDIMLEMNASVSDTLWIQNITIGEYNNNGVVGMCYPYYCQVQNGTTVRESNVSSVIADYGEYNYTYITPSSIFGNFYVKYTIVGYTGVTHTVNVYKRVGETDILIASEYSCYGACSGTITKSVIGVSLNITDYVIIRGYNGIIVNDTKLTYDYVPAPTITSPVNNSAQTSRIVNTTWNGTAPFQYQVSQESDFSTLIFNTTTSNNYSGNLALLTGTNYIRVLKKGNATQNTLDTNWSNTTQINIIGGLFKGSTYNNLTNLNLSVLPFSYTNVSNVSLLISSLGKRKESNISTTNIKARYRFEESFSSASFIDDVYGYNATIYDGVANLSGGFNSRARNISAAYAKTNNMNTYTNNVTVVAIFKPSRDMVAEASRWHILKSDGALGLNIGFNGWVDTLDFFSYNSTSVQTISTTGSKLYKNYTYHLVGTIGSGRMKVYLDGVQRDNISYVGDINTGSSNIFFGNDYTLTANGSFILDDYREYLGEWNSTQVLDDYNQLQTNTPNFPMNRSNITLFLPFDETSGITTTDFGQYGFNCSLNGTQNWNVNGKYNGAFDFDGSTNYFACGNPNTNVTTGLTLGAWVYHHTTAGAGTTDMIIAKSNWDTSQFAYFLDIDENNKPRIYISYNGADVIGVIGTTSVPLNEWHQIIGTYDNSTLRLYMDNVEVGNTSTSGTIFQSNSPLEIGTIISSRPSFSYDGLLDDVIVRSSSLNRTEINNEYYTSIHTRLNATLSNSTTSDYLSDSSMLMFPLSYTNTINISNITWGYALSRNNITINNNSNTKMNVSMIVEQVSNVTVEESVVNATSYNVNVTHLSDKNYFIGDIIIPIDNASVITEHYITDISLVSNNLNSSVTYNSTSGEFWVSTGQINNSNFYYNITATYNSEYSVSGLTYTSGYNYINWTWNNPELEYNYTEIYINGTWISNSSIPYYNQTGLLEWSLHNISITPYSTNIINIGAASALIGNTSGSVNTTPVEIFDYSSANFSGSNYNTQVNAYGIINLTSGATSGEYTSPVVDLGSVFSPYMLQMTTSTSGTGNVKVYIRTSPIYSNLSEIEWQGQTSISTPYINGTEMYAITNPVHKNTTRYIQYKVNLTRANITDMPKLHDIHIYFGNSTPIIKYIIAKNGTTISYKAFRNSLINISSEIFDYSGYSNINNVTISIVNTTGIYLLTNQTMTSGSIINAYGRNYYYQYNIPSDADFEKHKVIINATSFSGIMTSKDGIFRIDSGNFTEPSNNLLVGSYVSWEHAWLDTNYYKEYMNHTVDAGYDFVKILINLGWIEPDQYEFSETHWNSFLKPSLDYAKQKNITVHITMFQGGLPEFYNNGQTYLSVPRGYEQANKIRKAYEYIMPKLETYDNIDSVLIIGEDNIDLNGMEQVSEYNKFLSEIFGGLTINMTKQYRMRTLLNNYTGLQQLADTNLRDVDESLYYYSTSTAIFSDQVVISPLTNSSFIRLSRIKESQKSINGKLAFGEGGFQQGDVWAGQNRNVSSDDILLTFERVLSTGYDMGIDDILMWGDIWGFNATKGYPYSTWDLSTYMPKAIQFRNLLISTPRPTYYNVEIVNDNNEYFWLETSVPLLAPVDEQPYSQCIKRLDERGYSWYYVTADQKTMQRYVVVHNATINYSEIKNKNTSECNDIIDSKLSGVSPTKYYPWGDNVNRSISVTGMTESIPTYFNTSNFSDIFEFNSTYHRAYTDKNINITMTVNGAYNKAVVNGISISVTISGNNITFKSNASIQTNDIALELDSTLPLSITNLQNTTSTTSINWTWTDPEDSDLSYVIVWLNNVPQSNVSAGTQYFLASGLTPDTEYIISTRTVDTVGNVNQTWVNQTTRTDVADATEQFSKVEFMWWD